METDMFLITLFRMLQKGNLGFFDTMDGNNGKYMTSRRLRVSNLSIQDEVGAGYNR
jgi:hypothetical protein